MSQTLKRPHSRWIMALAWTGLTLFALLMPGVDAPLEGLLGLLKEIGLNAAHGISFAVLAVLWAWALRSHLPKRAAFMVTFVLMVAFAAWTEWAQGAYAVNRDPSLSDFIVDCIGAALALIAASRRIS
ncbi:MAG: VanZ family protein [Burkholderiales bacterium]|nr:VanZ family protein [Anaerolineae bacterium]